MVTGSSPVSPTHDPEERKVLRGRTLRTQHAAQVVAGSRVFPKVENGRLSARLSARIPISRPLTRPGERMAERSGLRAFLLIDKEKRRQTQKWLTHARRHAESTRKAAKPVREMCLTACKTTARIPVRNNTFRICVSWCAFRPCMEGIYGRTMGHVSVRSLNSSCSSEVNLIY